MTTTKHALRLLWCSVGITAGAHLSLAGLNPLNVSLSAIFFFWFLYRAYKRYLRRCSCCRPKGILHGWRVRRSHVREIPPRGIHDFTTVLSAHYRYCHECGYTEEERLPELKSFGHRPVFLQMW